MIYLWPFLTVVAGFWAAKIILPKSFVQFRLLLAFSGSFLLALTIFNLLPDIFKDYKPVYGWMVLLGIFIQIVLEFFSKGAEHGHVHLHLEKNTFPWLLFASLSLHSLMEGIPVNQHHGMIWGIVVHKFPVAIILSLFFLKSSLRSSTIFIFITAFALMTPLGMLLSDFWLDNASLQKYFSALVIGIFLHISTTILFETTEGHKFNLAKLVVVLCGFLLAYFI